MSEKRIKVWVQRFKDRPSLVLQWLDPETGKRKSKSAETDDEKKAEEKRADLEADLNAGRHKETSRMSWERFRALFEAEYVEGSRKGTQLNYEDTFDSFERLCSPTSLRAVNERTISRFVAEMRKVPCRGRSGMMASTIKVRLQFLHTALNWAAEQKFIPAVPKFPAIKVPKKKPQPIPTESFERMYEKAQDQQMQAYLLCGWLGGLRMREAALLEWDATDEAPYLDLRRNRMILPAGFVKGVEDQWVPLDPVLKEALLQLTRHGRKVFRFLASDGHEITPDALSDRVSRLAKLAGVKLTMHSLRKGFGCRYAGKVPAQVLQKLMRHSSIKTTMDYYANVDDAVEEAVLGPKPSSERQRNSLRNSDSWTVETHSGIDDATPFPDFDSARS